MKKFNFLKVLISSTTLFITACSNNLNQATSYNSKETKIQQISNSKNENNSIVSNPTDYPKSDESINTLSKEGKKIEFTEVKSHYFSGNLDSFNSNSSAVFLIKNENDFNKFFSSGEEKTDFAKQYVFAVVFVSGANGFKSKIDNFSIENKNLIISYKYNFIYSEDPMFNDYIRPRIYMVRFDKVDFDVLAVQQQIDLTLK